MTLMFSPLCIHNDIIRSIAFDCCTNDGGRIYGENGVVCRDVLTYCHQ